MNKAYAAAPNDFLTSSRA